MHLSINLGVPKVCNHMITCTDSELVTSWKAGHKGPLVKLAFNENNTYLATGSTDSVLKVWNIESHTCISKLTGVQDVTRYLIEYFSVGFGLYAELWLFVLQYFTV